MKPTPLPWHLENGYLGMSIEICDAHNNCVCELAGSFQYESDELIVEQEKVDGELIIKAIEFYMENYKGGTE